MEERYALARNNILPGTIMQDVANTYRDIAEKITGTSIPVSDDPKAEIIDILATDYDLIRS
jgi:phosphoribosylaminoimidazole-succinocarboxamide synthase